MRSLSLKAYQALARGPSDKALPDRPDRPDGLVVWAVVQDDVGLRAVIYLHNRLMQARGASHLLISAPDKIKAPKSKHLTCDPLPADHTAAAVAFLDHWRPDICLWLGGNLLPVTIAEADSRDIPMMLLGVAEEHMDQNLWRWMPSLARETISAFGTVTAATEDSARFLRKLMNSRRAFDVTPHLQIASPPPPVDDAHVEHLSTMTTGRSIWLAAHVQQDELVDVLSAHRQSMRLTHRLLLVLVCASFPVAMSARQLVQKDGWRCCFWEDGDTIDEATQVVLVEEPDNMGLWLRAAPVTFLASSLSPGHGGCDPYEAAALGSAVIYGPNVSAHLPSYSRLAQAGAARIVSDAHGLARALAQLLAVDQAATMAHAAWQVISSGAEATDAVVEQMQDLLDLRESAG